jgi:hypothetical protein
VRKDNDRKFVINVSLSQIRRRKHESLELLRKTSLVHLLRPWHNLVKEGIRMERIEEKLRVS